MLSQEGAWVVFAGDLETAGQIELYRAAVTGGEVLKINGPLPAGASVSDYGFVVSPDGHAVVYAGEQTRAGVVELWAAVETYPVYLPALGHP
jgi:hypothetical protein